VGIVDADAFPISERPSPAAPSAVMAVALFEHFCFAGSFTCGMVAFLRLFNFKWQARVVHPSQLPVR
jgi:hypothetical protein